MKSHTHTHTVTAPDHLHSSPFPVANLEKLTSFLNPDSCPIVDGVLLVVDHGVVPDESQVPLKLPHVVVLVRLHLLPHGAKIHRMPDDVEVVGDLAKQ